MRSGSRGSSSSGVGTENLLESSGVSSLVDSRSTCYGPNSSSPLADMEFLSAHRDCRRHLRDLLLLLMLCWRKNYSTRLQLQVRTTYRLPYGPYRLMKNLSDYYRPIWNWFGMIRFGPSTCPLSCFKAQLKICEARWFLVSSWLFMEPIYLTKIPNIT